MPSRWASARRQPRISAASWSAICGTPPGRRERDQLDMPQPRIGQPRISSRFRFGGRDRALILQPVARPDLHQPDPRRHHGGSDSNRGDPGAPTPVERPGNRIVLHAFAHLLADRGQSRARCHSPGRRSCLHLHRFQHQQRRALGDRGPRLHQLRNHTPGHRRRKARPLGNVGIAAQVQRIAPSAAGNHRRR